MFRSRILGDYPDAELRSFGRGGGGPQFQLTVSQLVSFSHLGFMRRS